jgi:hypothetical protein
MAEKRGAPLAQAPNSPTKYQRGIFPEDARVSGVGRAIDLPVQALNPYPLNVETGERELAVPGLFEGIAALGRGTADAIRNPVSTAQQAVEGIGGFLQEQMRASSIRPGQMVTDEEGMMRQATADELSAALDPTLGGTFAAPLVTRGALGGLEGLMPEAGVLTMSGIKGRTNRTPRVEQEDPYDLTPIKNVKDQPFYSAADSWAMENITVEMPIDKLKKKINAAVADPNSPLNELDRDFLLAYADKAKKTTTFTNERGRQITQDVVDPVELKRIVEEESIIPQIKTESINPGKLELEEVSEPRARAYENYPFMAIQNELYQYESQYGNRYAGVDNYTGELEVGFIRVTVPTEIIEKKSQDIVNPTDPDLVDARTAKLQPILDELSEVEDQRQTSGLRYNRLYDQVNKLVDQYYKNNNISFMDPITDHLEELKAAYPYGPTGGPGFEMLYNARNIVGESLNKINSERNEIFKKLRELNDVYKGPQGHPVLSPKSGRANLLFSRFVDQNATTADGKEVLPSIRLMDLQSDYMNDAASGRMAVPEIMPKMFDESSQAYRSLQKAAIKEAILNASERGKRAVILPDALASDRPDLYKSERMESLAKLVAKELGEGFEVKKLTVNSSTKYTNPDNAKEFKTDQWAIVFDPKNAEKYLDENMKFRDGGIVAVPARGRDGIADVIRKYRREALMD